MADNPEPNNFPITYLCLYSEALKDINLFRELVGDKLFDCDFDSIFTELSRRSCCKYIDLLYEAHTKILRGENPYKVLASLYYKI